MFWGSKRKEDDRDKQLKHLKAAFPSMRRPNNDDTLFELRFTVDNQYNTIRISVPEDFPQNRPVFQVIGPVTHQWLDGAKMVVGCRKLNDWNSKSSILEITEEILNAMLATRGRSSTPVDGQSAQQTPQATPVTQANTRPSTSNNGSFQYTPPPAPVSLTPQSGVQQPSYPQLSLQPLNNYQAPSPAPQQLSIPEPVRPVPQPTSSAAVQSLVRENSGGDGPHSPMQMVIPPVPSSFPELERLTDIQLERLLKDDVALDAHIALLESVQGMSSLRDMQRETNAVSVSSNLKLGEEVQALQKHAQDLQSELHTLITEHEATVRSITHEEFTTRERHLREIKQAVDKLDMDSDHLAVRFVDGEIDLATFNKEYIPQRSKYHALAARLHLAQSSQPPSLTAPMF